MVTIDDGFFGDFNPYREELGGDWFHPRGRRHLAGEVFLAGEALPEVSDLEELLRPETRRGWFCEQKTSSITLYACFADADPRTELVEISARPACFYPDYTGVNYISVSGFEMCMAATPWAPPTAEQFGLCGPHFALGWELLSNVLHEAKCSAISLGADRSTGQNEWSRLRYKHGAQRQREVVMRALQRGWSRETVGSHRVENNEIYNCGQAGICGHLGAIFSEIRGNHIHHIHMRDAFAGAEIAGIKLHAGVDARIEGNRIHHCTQGIWLDWQAQGTRVTANLLYANSWNDLFVEVAHGPYVVDNNIMLSPMSIRLCAQGGAYAYNLIGGRIDLQNVPNRYTPYHFPHSTAVAGFMTVLGGDDRYCFNLCAPVRPENRGGPSWYEDMFDAYGHPKLSRSDRESLESAPTDPAREWAPAHWHEHSLGLSALDAFPSSIDWRSLSQNLNAYLGLRLPVKVWGNAYLGSAGEARRDAFSRVFRSTDPSIRIKEAEGDVRLSMNLPAELAEGDAKSAGNDEPLTGEVFGAAFESEAAFEDTDGGPLILSLDYFGRKRANPAVPGPFADPVSGQGTIRVWPRC
jgi:5-methylcytosine-specific restriction endonuclease McrA